MIEELDDVIHEALENGHSVELVKAERYGYQIAIDGTPLFDGVEGLPRETFGWPLKDVPIHPESEEMVEQMLKSKKRRLRENRMKQIDASDHCDSEGETVR